MKKLLMALAIMATSFVTAVAVATPALANASGSIQQEYSPWYTANVVSIAINQAVFSSGGNGRNFTWDPNGGSYEQHNTGEIYFTNNTSVCLSWDPTDGDQIFTTTCGNPGTVWAKVNLSDGVHFRFINIYGSNFFGADQYMTSDNTPGGYWYIDCRSNGNPCASGEDQSYGWA